MLTGDNATTARAVADRLGIDQVEAEVLPDHKADVVQRLRAEGRVVAMAGDGVNDAPALAAADVGLAMSSGTDVAIESAGITLLNGDLTGIVRARRLSEMTMRNIRQNLWFAFVYNAAGIPIAAGVLYPFFGLLLSPIIAAAAMALSSVSSSATPSASAPAPRLTGGPPAGRRASWRSACATDSCSRSTATSGVTDKMTGEKAGQSVAGADGLVCPDEIVLTTGSAWTPLEQRSALWARW